MHITSTCWCRRLAGTVAFAAALLVPEAVPCASVLPANLDPGIFRAEFEKMWARSETFRRQCDRLAAAPYLRVTVGRAMHRVNGNRGETVIRREAGLVVRAFIRIWEVHSIVEVLAHEIEHVIEQLDGVRLVDKANARHIWRTVYGFESRRAIEIGLKVAGEVDYRSAPARRWGSRSHDRAGAARQ
jgi:hypothetical protein